MPLSKGPTKHAANRNRKTGVPAGRDARFIFRISYLLPVTRQLERAISLQILAPIRYRTGGGCAGDC
jgi:hypothetical protein